MILKYLSLVSVFIIFAFSLVLFFKKTTMNKANNILAFIFFIVAVCLALLNFKSFAFESKAYHLFAYYFPITIPLALIGPSMFLYVREIFGKPVQVISKSFLLQLIVVLPGLADTIYFYTWSANARITCMIANFSDIDWITKANSAIFFVQFLSYLVYCYFFVKEQLSISESHHNKATIKSMMWIKNFFLFDIFLMLIVIPIIIYSGKDSLMVPMELIVLNCQCFYIFFKSLWQNGVFNEEAVAITSNVNPISDESTSQKQLIPDEQADKHIAVLHALVSEKELYLQANFSIQELSELSKISVHHISYCINTKLNKSFSDFVNDYRIELAKNTLHDSDSSNLTIEAIGLNCGFGSKSSFNAVFKKYTLVTPTEYRKLQI